MAWSLNRTLRLCLGVLALPAFALAAQKPPFIGYGENTVVKLDATVFPDREGVKDVLGNDLGGYYVVIQLKLSPKGGPLKIDRDDFLLRTDRDGEKSKPYAPSQIAGSKGLVISQRADGDIMAQQRGPVFGGLGGIPGMLGGPSGGVGNTAGPARNEANEQLEEKIDPLMAVLTAKALPEKEVGEPVTGLLYFLMEPKQKPKDLELFYSPRGASKITVRFHKP